MTETEEHLKRQTAHRRYDSSFLSRPQRICVRGECTGESAFAAVHSPPRRCASPLNKVTEACRLVAVTALP